MLRVVFLNGLCWVLFCFLFVNYIANSVNCCCKAFSDDFKLYLRFPRNTCAPILQEMMRLQRNLDKVCSVIRSWNLRLNIKCIAFRCGAYNPHNKMDCTYSADGKRLEIVTSHRDLGVLKDSIKATLS